MEYTQIVHLLKLAFQSYFNQDYNAYNKHLFLIDSDNIEAGSSLMGEHILIQGLSSRYDLLEFSKIMKHALSLIKGHSQVIPNGSPITLGTLNPVGCYWLEYSKADETGRHLKTAVELWYRLTGGGLGTDILYQAYLSYYRGNLNESFSQAQNALQKAKDFHQLDNELCAGELLSLLMRHGFYSHNIKDNFKIIRDIANLPTSANQRYREAAQIIQSNIFLSIGLLNKTPSWIQNGDFGMISSRFFPGYRPVEKIIIPCNFPAAFMNQLEYLTYSGQLAKAINLADSSEKMFHADNPLFNIYTDFCRCLCFLEIGDKEQTVYYFDRVMDHTVADHIWLIPAELATYAPDLPIHNEKVDQSFLQCLNILRNDFHERINSLREVYRDKSLADNLTPREREISELAASGMSNNAIADILGIKERTVKNHLQNVYGKLNIISRTQIENVLTSTDDSIEATWVKKKLSR